MYVTFLEWVYIILETRIWKRKGISKVRISMEKGYNEQL